MTKYKMYSCICSMDKNGFISFLSEAFWIDSKPMESIKVYPDHISFIASKRVDQFPPVDIRFYFRELCKIRIHRVTINTKESCINE